MHEVWTNEDTLAEFAGQTVGHYTDNKAVCYIIVGGYRQPKLQSLVMSIFLALIKHSIVLTLVWITRESEIIMWADSGSSNFRSDKYSLDPVSFQSIEHKFGKFTVDCMASAPNTVCRRFFSRYSSSGLFGVNLPMF